MIIKSIHVVHRPRREFGGHSTRSEASGRCPKDRGGGVLSLIAMSLRGTKQSPTERVLLHPHQNIHNWITMHKSPPRPDPAHWGLLTRNANSSPSCATHRRWIEPVEITSMSCGGDLSPVLRFYPRFQRPSASKILSIWNCWILWQLEMHQKPMPQIHRHGRLVFQLLPFNFTSIF